MNNSISINDDLSLKDERSSGLWAKTEVLGGYDFINNPNGKSSLGEVCFTQHNIVPIGGVSYVMERVFGIKETQIEIPTLYDESGIGIANSLPPTETYQKPGGQGTVHYRYGHFTQLFGVGITGTGENDITVYNPDYREKSINITVVNPDGLTVRGTMIPFRYTTEVLSTVDRLKYFGKKVDDEGVTSYFLKRFDTEAVIKHIWKTGEDVEEETLVPSSDVWENINGLNAVESFTEIILKISKEDVKEWFIHLEQADRARINTIALFNGEYVKDEEDPTDFGDYRDVKMFSKLCINPEYLNLNKDLTIIYRVYGS